jgi:hypothetical protein
MQMKINFKLQFQFHRKVGHFNTLYKYGMATKVMLELHTHQSLIYLKYVLYCLVILQLKILKLGLHLTLGGHVISFLYCNFFFFFLVFSFFFLIMKIKMSLVIFI